MVFTLPQPSSEELDFRELNVKAICLDEKVLVTFHHDRERAIEESMSPLEMPSHRHSLLMLINTTAI